MKELIEELTEDEQRTIKGTKIANTITILSLFEQLNSLESVLKAKDIVNESEINIAKGVIRKELLEKCLPDIKKQIRAINNPFSELFSNLKGNNND